MRKNKEQMDDGGEHISLKPAISCTLGLKEFLTTIIPFASLILNARGKGILVFFPREKKTYDHKIVGLFRFW